MEQWPRTSPLVTWPCDERRLVLSGQEYKSVIVSIGYLRVQSYIAQRVHRIRHSISQIAARHPTRCV
eukprot:18992-Eustigmatos_ZCMA.PRE.1